MSLKSFNDNFHQICFSKNRKDAEVRGIIVSDKNHFGINELLAKMYPEIKQYIFQSTEIDHQLPDGVPILLRLFKDSLERDLWLFDNSYDGTSNVGISTFYEKKNSSNIRRRYIYKFITLEDGIILIVCSYIGIKISVKKDPDILHQTFKDNEQMYRKFCSALNLNNLRNTSKQVVTSERKPVTIKENVSVKAKDYFDTAFDKRYVKGIVIKRDPYLDVDDILQKLFPDMLAIKDKKVILRYNNDAKHDVEFNIGTTNYTALGYRIFKKIPSLLGADHFKILCEGIEYYVRIRDMNYLDFDMKYHGPTKIVVPDSVSTCIDLYYKEDFICSVAIDSDNDILDFSSFNKFKKVTAAFIEDWVKKTCRED